MLSAEKLSYIASRLKKISREKGSWTAMRKLAQLLHQRLCDAPRAKTSKKWSSYSKTCNFQALGSEMEKTMSSGLLRPLHDLKRDIRSMPPQISARYVEEAEKILSNRFTIYGDVEVRFGPKGFSWAHDPLTGFNWPPDFDLTKAVIQMPLSTDLKNVLELGRFQFLSTLAYAYTITGREAFSSFAIEKVESWIDTNPLARGPHWMMAMEAAIRLANWAMYLPLLNLFNVTSEALKMKLTRSFVEHLFFIYSNLEKSPFSATNHYLADIVALLMGRIIFPSNGEIGKMSELAEHELEREMMLQFDSSGLNFEGSLPYHRLSSEICIFGIALMKRSGRGPSGKTMDRLKAMAEFVDAYTHASATHPVIGDNDSGIYVKFFTDQEKANHDYLIPLFDFLLSDRADPKNQAGFFSAMHFCAPKSRIPSKNTRQNADQDRNLAVHDFNGLIIAYRKDEALYFNMQKATEGHTHNDKLAVYPVIGRRLLFLDRGTYSYRGYMEKRHQDRMSLSHNGPVINSWEQNRLWKSSLFHVDGETDYTHAIENGEGFVTISGSHNGYARFRSGLTVFRKLEWDVRERRILISDWAEGGAAGEEYHFNWQFLVNPEWQTVIDGKRLFVTSDTHEAVFENLDGAGFFLKTGYYCPTYQTEAPCPAVVFYTRAKADRKIRFLLRY